MNLESPSRIISMVRVSAGVVMIAFGGFVIGYLSIWWALARGLVRALRLIQHYPMAQGAVAVDIVRIGSSAIIGWGGTVFILVGAQLVVPGSPERPPWEHVHRSSAPSDADHERC